jgi:hypothetical protein
MGEREDRPVGGTTREPGGRPPGDWLFQVLPPVRRRRLRPRRGLVRLVFEGGPDGLVEAESERWQAVEGLTERQLRRYKPEGDDGLQA